MESGQSTQNDNTASKGEIVLYSRDVFFGMRVRTIVKQLGYSIVLDKDLESFVDHTTSDPPQPVLALVDFNQPVDWDHLRDVLASGVPVIGFGSHKDVDGFRKAKRAGVDRVVSNGDFSRNLPDLIANYARSSEE